MELNGNWLKGDWLQTYTGKQFWPLDPQQDAIDIFDIAHALSHQCRYGGHCKKFYSVAEHVVHVSLAVPPQDALWGLLHDAAEAYLVDVPRPIKKFLGNYDKIEANLMAAIQRKFGLQGEMPLSVKDADNAILFTERAALLSKPPADWDFEGVKPLDCPIHGWGPEQAEYMFLERFVDLDMRRRAA